MNRYRFFSTIKYLSILLTALLFSFAGISHPKINAMKTDLLIVDIQNFYFTGDDPGLVHGEEASLAAKEIRQVFREKNNWWYMFVTN